MPATAFAEPTEEEEKQGKSLAKEALGAYNEGEFQDAADKFAEARQLYPAGQVLRMSGYTFMALEQWLDAADMLDQALATTYKPLLPRDAEHAQDNLNEVMKNLAVVEVMSSVDGSMLTIDDGEAIQLPHKQRLAPGTYRLTVTAEGHDPRKKEITAAAGDRLQFKMSPREIKPDPVPVAPPPMPVAPPDEVDEPSDMFGWFPYQGWVGIGVAGAGVLFTVIGIGVGAYGGSLRGAVQENIDAHNAGFDANCSRHRDLCLSNIALINQQGQSAEDHQTSGLVLGLTGVTMMAIGTGLFLFSDMSPLAPKTANDGQDTGSSDLPIRCAVSFGGMGCEGTF